MQRDPNLNPNPAQVNPPRVSSSYLPPEKELKYKLSLQRVTNGPTMPALTKQEAAESSSLFRVDRVIPLLEISSF